MTYGISGTVITYNEEYHIADCIQSLKTVCDEIIVIDSGSEDATQAIAEKLGAKVYTQKFLGYGPQKNICTAYSKNKWILNLDADERLDKNGQELISKLDLQNSSYDAYALRRKNFIGNRWIKGCGWYPDNCIRLFNKDKTAFSEQKVHEKIMTRNYKRLDGDITHYSYRTIGELLSSKYTKIWAKAKYEEGYKINSFSPVMHALYSFFLCYVIKRGFMGGVDGITVSLSSCVYTYFKYAQLLEYYRDKTTFETDA